jgi:type II secretory pathway predicted ATPase ExeA
MFPAAIDAHLAAACYAAIVGGLSAEALDERIAIVGTSGSGKTCAAKGLVERLLATEARICIVDPPGVWWGFAMGS